MKGITQIALCLVIITLCIIVPKIVHAAPLSTTVNATIKISVCGNIIAEGGEDCDNTDLNGKTCQSLGYGGGALSCDISCSYDTTSCTIATPTPTTTPSIPAIQITSSVNPTTIPVSPLPTDTPTPSVEQRNFFSPLFASLQSFPQALRYLGANKDGFIPHEKLQSSVQLWVTNWKSFISNQDTKDNRATKPTNTSKCDLNGDHICDLTDFSIMLYYVKK